MVKGLDKRKHVIGVAYSKAATILDLGAGSPSYIDRPVVLSVSLGTVVSVSMSPHVGVMMTSLLAEVKEGL